MPLPTDPEVVQTSGDLVKQLQTIFGKHPGARPGEIAIHITPPSPALNSSLLQK
jgi:hypothetical protein